jgi:Domain of unknown function DUF29
MQVAELYDLDFAEWARRNAELLRSGRVSEADLEHIAEEIEAMAKRERRALYNRFVRLIEHLLKWEYQPRRRGTSWRLTAGDQRRKISQLLEDNPSFRPLLSKLVPKAYQEALSDIAIILGRPKTSFPEDCPYTLEQLLDEEFLPDGASERRAP